MGWCMWIKKDVMGLCRINEETCVCCVYEDVLLEAILFIFADGTMVRSSALGRSVSKSCLTYWVLDKIVLEDTGYCLRGVRIVIPITICFITTGWGLRKIACSKSPMTGRRAMGEKKQLPFYVIHNRGGKKTLYDENLYLYEKYLFL